MLLSQLQISLFCKRCTHDDAVSYHDSDCFFFFTNSFFVFFLFVENLFVHSTDATDELQQVFMLRRYATNEKFSVWSEEQKNLSG